MSYKLGLVLSMVFVILFFLLGIDLITIQFAFGNLDAKSTSISYRISEHGTIDDAFIQEIEEYYKVDFECERNCTPLFGEMVEYTLISNVKTLVVGKGEMTIRISRSTMIGFYN